MNTIRAFASPEAHVIYGTAYDESLGDQIRVTVVATGLAQAGRRVAPPLSVIRTGTDNVAYTQTTTTVTAAPSASAQETSTAPSALTGNDMANVNVPSVWRTNRTQAAAKVDALSSGGMDNYEIPAFLRKQAD